MKCGSRGYIKSECRSRHRSDSCEEDTPGRRHTGASLRVHIGTKRTDARLRWPESDEGVKKARARRWDFDLATKMTTLGRNTPQTDSPCRKTPRNGLIARFNVYIYLPQRRVGTVDIDTKRQTSVYPYDFGWRVTLSPLDLHRYTRIANDSTDKQLADDYIEPHWPGTVSPIARKRDVVVPRDYERNIWYPDTRRTKRQLRDFPDASTSGSTTFDNESSPHDAP